MLSVGMVLLLSFICFYFIFCICLFYFIMCICLFKSSVSPSSIFNLNITTPMNIVSVTDQESQVYFFKPHLHIEMDSSLHFFLGSNSKNVRIYYL